MNIYEQLTKIWNPTGVPLTKLKLERIAATMSLIGEVERQLVYAQLKIKPEEHKAFVERIQKEAQRDAFLTQVEDEDVPET